MQQARLACKQPFQEFLLYDCDEQPLSAAVRVARNPCYLAFSLLSDVQ